MLRDLSEKLVRLGLTKKEADIYLVLLNEGSMPIDDVGKRTGNNRSTTYVQLSNLAERGLVTSHKQGKKVIFTAESPNNLERLLDQMAVRLEQQRAETAQFLPNLMKMYGSTGTRPVVRLFEGKDGLASMRNSILDQKPEKMYALSSIDEMRKVFTKKELDAFTAKREALGIKSYVMYSLESGDDFIPHKLQEFKRIDRATMPFGSDVYIYDDTVSFASVGESIVGMTITNAGIAKSVQSLFDSLWRSI